MKEVAMKNYESLQIPKGTIGYLSQNGHKNWWYPNSLDPIEIPMDVVAHHLSLWFHQDRYLAFKVPRIIFHPKELESYKDSYVCIWFPKEEIDGIANTEAI